MNTPNFQNYTKAVRKFIEDSKEWGALDQYKFYTCEMTVGEPEIVGAWKETPDNAHGGLDVAWAFGQNPTYTEYLEHYAQELEILLAGLYVE
jgi:hypothetical protein